jgi:hypothetical protein
LRLRVDLLTACGPSSPAEPHIVRRIRWLARRKGIDLSATRWTTDVERLIKELDRVMKSSSGS